MTDRSEHRTPTERHRRHSEQEYADALAREFVDAPDTDQPESGRRPNDG